MPNQRDVAIFVGSLRQDGFSHRLSRALEELAPRSLRLREVEFGSLPLYDQDLEEHGPLPQEWKAFRDEVRRADAVLFVTPEYNRSIPGGLKNALDVGSRPYGQSAWEGKPGGVVSVSPGAIGAFGANHHLRQALVFLNVPVMAQPEAYVGGAADLFDEQGKLKNDGTRKFLGSFMESFAGWVEANALPVPQQVRKAS